MFFIFKVFLKGLDFVNQNDVEDIIPFLKKDFSSSNEEELTKVITNYKNISVWPENMNFSEESFNKLINIVKEAKELDKDVVVPYESLVTDHIINKSKENAEE